MTLVGYGTPGTGQAGQIRGFSDPFLRLKASNQIDADASTLKANMGSGMAWTQREGTQLIADFDDGKTARDALGLFINREQQGVRN